MKKTLLFLVGSFCIIFVTTIINILSIPTDSTATNRTDNNNSSSTSRVGRSGFGTGGGFYHK